MIPRKCSFSTGEPEAKLPYKLSGLGPPKVIDFKLEQSAKISKPYLVTDIGIVTEVKELHPLKQ